MDNIHHDIVQIILLQRLRIKQDVSGEHFLELSVHGIRFTDISTDGRKVKSGKKSWIFLEKKKGGGRGGK